MRMYAQQRDELHKVPRGPRHIPPQQHPSTSTATILPFDLLFLGEFLQPLISQSLTPHPFFSRSCILSMGCSNMHRISDERRQKICNVLLPQIYYLYVKLKIKSSRWACFIKKIYNQCQHSFNVQNSDPDFIQNQKPALCLMKMTWRH